MSELSYLEILRLALPETALVITALVVLASDLLALRKDSLSVRLGFCASLAVLGCVAAGVLLVMASGAGDVGGGMFVVTPLIRLVKLGVLAMAVPALLVSAQGRFTTHAGEYVALILFAVVGMMFLVSAEDLLMVFVALEMTSLSLYVLTAFHKREVGSAEAALKYFLFGGMSAALALFGFSLLYGLTGSTNLNEMAQGVGVHASDPLLVVALIGVLAGLGFKVAVVPFHLWAPDVYQGAPTPSAALIATGSKVASFFILAKLMMVGLAGSEGSAAWGRYGSGWVLALAIAAAASMILGNLAALAQSSVKRLLAYSAIAHAGYVSLAILSNDSAGLTALLYYVFVYGLATMGAFAVVSVVEQQTGGDRLEDFTGLARRAPVLALGLLVFLLSLAGIPPLAGFFGKFYVFAAAAGAEAGLGLFWLVILGIAMSVVSLYYYLMVLKRAYVQEPGEEVAKFRVNGVATATVAILALAVVILGCFPDWILHRIATALG
ncbi:MAG: NADH-quinone oxidoreductase subunit N [Verrucomicrobia bacterium]|nr:NADH-quinone oxidoreductase subunit N [Verrucomicrobiota bacterium]